ncbi:AAA family ATPase [Parerythrobacter jejuensis]|uniref:AAA family ATPase n=1 Tax=Parerythrobacter jejuensis TaxID=795812 RepID=A0A845APX2_9SPHN|nr:ATP-binding protein [Parerythrobacter jejuensis]MXP30945.1 AAA family ATPase [Parerythrobacter jejuensis]MXP33705.1 AAA family ATPase [Parerythrobacter jejuensis]
MGLSGPRRFAITGAPGAGKSTLIEALTARGWNVVTESARAILQRPGGMELRENDPHGFALAMLEADRAIFEEAMPGQTLIFDRGFADIIAFLRIEKVPVSDVFEKACQHLRFDAPVFRAPAWKGIYRQDDQRIQTWDEAVESDRQCTKAWREFGYELLDLPLASVEERVAFVERHLGPDHWPKT